jgi:DNA polymerase
MYGQVLVAKKAGRLMGPQKENLAKLYNHYIKDPLFEHFRADDINFVPGSGVLKPKVMLIGEAPGRIENAKKIPFVGPAGQVLTEILHKVGIDPIDEVFFTNIVKYWPRTSERKTRTPSSKEIEDSKAYILEEIRIVEPIFVGLCGLTSIRCIFPNVPTVRSQHANLLNGRYVPLYHPAVVLYKQEKYDEILMGYRVLKSLIDAKETNGK